MQKQQNMKVKIKTRRSGNGNGETSSSSSAQILASTDDLLTEILLRLPIKSLIRFKLVSKHWLSLITNPHFSILRNPSPNPAVGLFLHHSCLRIRLTNPGFEYVSFSLNKSSNPPFRKLNFTKHPSGIGILQSCNGLMLCSTFRAQDRASNPVCYYVYNPTTKMFSKLPKLERIQNSTTTIHGMSLAFDPAKSPHYRALCVRGLESDSGDYRYQIEVYSSETGPWRKCGVPFTAQSSNFENGVYWNGAVHWISNKGGDSLYFNLDDDGEKPKRLPMPPIPDGWEWRCNYYFGESCDHLHYIELLGVVMMLKVHEMKRDHSKWFVKYKVDLSPVVASYPMVNRENYDLMHWYSHGLSALTVVRGEKEEDAFLVLQIPGKVLRYSLVCGSFETIHEFKGAEVEVDEGSLRYPTTNAFQYIESLSCV